jgi:hypothetical protein
MIYQKALSFINKKVGIINIITLSVVVLVTINLCHLSDEKKIDWHKEQIHSYELDFVCLIHSNDTNRQNAAQTFDRIYHTGYWGAEESKSGGGSTIPGALDWITYLNFVIKKYQIRYVADIPCGDTNWQFSSRQMNTIPFYFGGDISAGVISQNQKHYHNHLNKMFLLWDLVQCSIPPFSIKNSTGFFSNNTFDLIIVRDAIQHMNILNGLKVMKNIIKSGIPYFAVSSFPSQPCANFCRDGNISDGATYPNNMNCPPFSLPVPLLRKPSHNTIKHEPDEFHLYMVLFELLRK